MSEECNKIITKETLVPIGLIITAITILGSVVWMFATLTATVNQHSTRIDRIETMMERIATKEDLKALEQNIRTYLIK